MNVPLRRSRTACASSSFSARAVEAEDGSVKLVFQEVPAGWFVVAILHDQDENEKLSFNMLGMPKEKYGFSMNPVSRFGPPKFEKAAVFLEEGERKELVIELG